MIPHPPRLFGRLVWPVLLLTAVSVPLHAQQPAPEFLTGPCPRTDSAAATNLADVTSNPEVPPTLKSGMHVPAFPSEIHRPGYDGQVVVAFVVDEHGRVDPASVFVMRSSDSVLSRWACKAAPRIRFNPARDHGRAVASQAMLPFTYHGPPAKDTTSHGGRHPR